MQERQDKPRGLLNSKESSKRFRLARYLPGKELAPYVEHYWFVRWDLTGQEPYVQENLPYPSVHAVFETRGSLIYGVMTGRFIRRLEGVGAAMGIKFLPGGFYPFVRFPVARITNRTLPLEALFPEGAVDLERRILSSAHDEKAMQAAEAALRRILPQPDENVALVNRIVGAISSDRTVLKVEDLAVRVGMSRRTLQRLFNTYVGASPKWVIARYRLFEAAEMLEQGDGSDLGTMALALGYFDQAHFIKDFRRIVGSPPARYARAGASAGSP